MPTTSEVSSPALIGLFTAEPTAGRKSAPYMMTVSVGEETFLDFFQAIADPQIPASGNGAQAATAPAPILRAVGLTGVVPLRIPDPSIIEVPEAPVGLPDSDPTEAVIGDTLADVPASEEPLESDSADLTAHMSAQDTTELPPPLPPEIGNAQDTPAVQMPTLPTADVQVDARSQPMDSIADLPPPPSQDVTDTKPAPIQRPDTAPERVLTKPVPVDPARPTRPVVEAPPAAARPFDEQTADTPERPDRAGAERPADAKAPHAPGHSVLAQPPGIPVAQSVGASPVRAVGQPAQAIGPATDAPAPAFDASTVATPSSLVPRPRATPRPPEDAKAADLAPPAQIVPAKSGGEDAPAPLGPATGTGASTSAQPAAAPPLPPPHPGFVVRQIAEHVASAQPGGTVEIRLSPEELGHVRLSLHHGDGGLTVQISAERPETLDLIRRNLPDLDRSLRDLGHQSLGFSFADRRGERQPTPQQQQSTFATDETEPIHSIAPAAQRPLAVGPRTGLDLRL